MRKFVIRRLLAIIPVLVAVGIISFLLLHIVPGDPVTAFIGEYPAPPEYVEQIWKSFGLDQPLLVQLWLYIKSVAVGNFGYSFANQQPVLTLILGRVGNTLILMIPAVAMSSVIGILLALLAVRVGGVFDTIVTCLALIGYSIPIFWLGQMLVLIFAVNLHWLPAQGMVSLRGLPPGNLAWMWDVFLHWILPAVVISSYYVTVIARVARSSLREASGQDFVTTAYAKGLSKREVLWKHIFPNALIPIVSIIGFSLGNAVTGTVMVEAVFGWPGLGGLFLSSINARDYPVLQGVFLLAAFTVVLANLLTDIAYGLVDPRVRHGIVGK